MYKTTILTGLGVCIILILLFYRPLKNFLLLLITPVGDRGINIVSIELSILKNPNDTVAYYNRGILYSQGIDYQAAIRDFTKVISLNSNPEEASQAINAAHGYRRRGDVYREIGDNQRAIMDYKRAAALYEKHGAYIESQYMTELIESLLKHSSSAAE